MFIVSLTYTRPIAEIETHLAAHRLYLDKYYASGNFLFSGRKEPRTGGIIILRADSLKHAEQILSEDPFNQAGVADYQITEFVPSKSAPALAEWLEQ